MGGSESTLSRDVSLKVPLARRCCGCGITKTVRSYAKDMPCMPASESATLASLMATCARFGAYWARGPAWFCAACGIYHELRFTSDEAADEERAREASAL